MMPSVAILQLILQLHIFNRKLRDLVYRHKNLRVILCSHLNAYEDANLTTWKLVRDILMLTIDNGLTICVQAGYTDPGNSKLNQC